jgi:hypothetical protein
VAKWVKGQSGNPNGRPKEDETLTALAKTYTNEAILKLASLMRSSKSPPMVQAVCARELLDRGHGRPHQSISGTLDLTVRQAFVQAIADAPDVIQRFTEEQRLPLQ